MMNPETRDRLETAERLRAKGLTPKAAAAAVGWDYKTFMENRRRARLPLLMPGDAEHKCPCGKGWGHPGRCKTKQPATCALSGCTELATKRRYCSQEHYFAAVRAQPPEQRAARMRPVWVASVAKRAKAG